MRRRRRGNLRYRAPRFLNRRKPAGWLAPSLQHRVDTAMAWVVRFQRWAPVTAFNVLELLQLAAHIIETPGDFTGEEIAQAKSEIGEFLAAQEVVAP